MGDIAKEIKILSIYLYMYVMYVWIPYPKKKKNCMDPHELDWEVEIIELE